MYGCESWTIRKAERQRIDAFELWCWRRLLRVPWTCKEIQPVHPKGDQPWVFTGGTDVEAETPILWPSDVKSWLIWKVSDAGKIEGRRRRDDRGWNGWMASPTQSTWAWVDCWSWWWTGRPGVLWFMVSQRVGHDWVTEFNWTEWKGLFKAMMLLSGLFLTCFSHSGSFAMSCFFASGGQSTGVSAKRQSFQWIFRVDFL